MMGQQPRTESLFYYFRLQDQIPEDHLLRVIDRHIDFSFVREQLKEFYSPMGRPSIDPEVVLRLLLISYLYGITSERRLLDEVRMYPAHSWFTRLGFEKEIPDDSTFSKNRHGRFRQCGVFRKVFEEIVSFSGFYGCLSRPYPELTTAFYSCRMTLRRESWT
jgi:transposase